MIGSTRKLKVWAYPQPCYLRKGFNGLYGLVTEGLGRDPLDGDVYLFCNRKRTSAKALHFDGTGLCIYMKRLETCRFACLWSPTQAGCLMLTMSELALFLEGSALVGKGALSPREIRPLPVAI